MMAAVSILLLIATIIGLVIRDRMVARERRRAQESPSGARQGD